MHGVCMSCGKKTSTPKTKHCKVCHARIRLQEKEKLAQQVLVLVLEKGFTAAETSRLVNKSREAIRQILVDKGIDYASIKQKRMAIPLGRNTKFCKKCGKEFEVNKNGARVKYCSEKCYNENHREVQARRIKAYYQTVEGKAKQKEYVRNHKEKIRKYFTEWREKRDSEQPTLEA